MLPLRFHLRFGRSSSPIPCAGADQQRLRHVHRSQETNNAGPPSVVDFIPPIGPIQIAMAVPQRRPTVTLEPDGKSLRGAWQNGIWSETVDRVDIHAIVAFG